MAKHLLTGISGETAAQNYLLECGYLLLHKNWRYKHLEVDIVMRDQDTLVFVEVKTRTDGRFGLPYESVNWQKQRKLSQAATIYIKQHHYEGEIRFDVVSIFANPSDQYNIRHIKDAFWPRYS
ncbi:YraN family protein [Olivibacter sp. SDN3]|uniref:YraN family protein n=1 Tax=Olivibacter sp. SDN3 TaxID=2764720 RepID=UPI001651AF64|nr:YraN family protein [Olivibacter sp. SDN3]QNL50642.1 YraN family protein [Olivibacter sp. SDN3]